MRNLDQILDELSPERRSKVDARAAELIAEERTRQEFRKARAKTQTQLAKALGVRRHNVYKMEKEADLRFSALRKAVEDAGGKLSFVLEYPNRAPVVLSGIAEEKAVRKVPKSQRSRASQPAVTKRRVISAN